MLGIKSPTLTTGYWNDSALTSRSRLSGYWLTGDLVRQDEDGRFFHLDRVSDVIRTAEGPLYSLLAEELIMSALAEVADCTVVGSPRPGGVEQAHLFLQPSRDVDPDRTDRQEVLARVNALLAGHGLPAIATADWAAAGQLPVGPTGKVRKAALRASLAGSDQPAESEPGSPPDRTVH